MRGSGFCLLAVVLFSTNAFAGVCENALRTIDRKLQTAQNKCTDQSDITKLRDRLTNAKNEKSQTIIQKQIDKALAKQKTFCAQVTTDTAASTKIKSFCSIAAGANTSYCTQGFSLRVRGTDASSRCKRGRLWFADKNKCYYEEEYYYTSQTEFGNGKATGRGEVLYSGQPAGTNFYQINTGFLVDGITNSNDCQGNK